jgi:hypothetical protein
MREGEMAFAKADAPTISGDLPTQLIAKLKIESILR